MNVDRINVIIIRQVKTPDMYISYSFQTVMLSNGYINEANVLVINLLCSKTIN